MKFKRIVSALLLACLLCTNGLAAELKLPSSLKTIGEEAFLNDSALETVVVPEGTLEIRSRAFADSSAGEIYLPQSLTIIADDAFDGCENAVLYVHKNSYAHQWCAWNGAEYVVLGDAEEILYALDGLVLNAAGNGASLWVTAAKACVLRAEVLDNDGKTVLQSAEIPIAEGTKDLPGEVVFAQKLPVSFILRAVLVDEKGNQLCQPVTNHRYSAAYAAFESQSPEDFPEDRRVSFGESGYAVLAENVLALDAQAAYSAGQYIFSSNQSLAAGDVIRIYADGEEKLLKIGSVSTLSDGRRAVTEDANVYLSDFYDVINLDADLRSGTASKGENVNETIKVFSEDHSISVGLAELSMHLEMSVHLKFAYDKENLGEDYFDIQLTANTGGNIGVFFGGEVDTWKNDNAPAFQIYNSVVIIPGISAPAFLNVSVPLNIMAKLGGNVSFGFANQYGFYYNTDDGFTKVESGDSFADMDLEGEFEIFTGPEVSLSTTLFGLVSARIGGQFGPRITGVTESPSYGGNTADVNASSIHACKGCVDGDIYATANLKGTLLYKLSEKVSGTLLELNIAAYDEKLYDWFLSYNNEEESIYEGQKTFGMTECKNRKYCITGTTIGMDGKETSGIPVTFTGKKIQTMQGSSPFSVYLYKGEYHALAGFASGDVERDFLVDDSAFGLILEEKEMVIEGYVRDADTQKPISGASVLLSMPGGKTKTTATDADGFYRFDSLPGGTYTVTYSAASYKSDSYENMKFAAGTRNQLNMILHSNLLMDEEVVKKLMAYMGDDLIQRLKDAKIVLNFDFTYYVPSDEEADYENGQLQISVELRSAVKSTWPEFIVDTDLLREAQYAVLESGVFDFTQEEIDMFKQYYYQPNAYGGYYADEYTDDRINLHINETPSYEAIVYVRHPYLKNSGNKQAWTSDWRFDEMTYASSGRPK